MEESHDIHPNLNDQQQYRLKKINEDILLQILKKDS